jgi:sugar phosphate isomerase/epimerase
MLSDPVSRREAIQKGAAVVLPLVAGASARGQQQEKDELGPTIGIATLGFRDLTNRQLATELAREGIHVVQLFLNQTDSRYWKYNDRSDVSALTADRCAAIAGDYRSAGVSIHSIGVYTNLIHPDPAERKANLAYFEAMMRIGDAMDVHAFITEAGHYHGDAPEPPVPLHFQEDVWKRMVATGKELAKLAEGHRATLLFEPFYRGFLSSAKRARLFLEDLGSPRIRALLDPANLLEVNDLEEMFDQLSPWIDCLHAKDRKLHVDRGVPAGQGDLDYPKFVALAARRTPKAPLILEYVGRKDYKQALEHLRSVLRRFY